MDYCRTIESANQHPFFLHVVPSSPTLISFCAAPFRVYNYSEFSARYYIALTTAIHLFTPTLFKKAIYETIMST
ncbi:hypothetical protein P691DRAFT_95523 [Macrolepiota fuliginosa MF-IS2]|uniref:Uncharacterized protein n=1 Tax=Macrolepiota fuliginosa MF-IS2 TaxID=1400762 RepID=A0A9P5XAE6_9AGAR|nr:hypothetical protein P691DRAFT_95523 [Macrolepiota fuliginosa MF-IS2]